MLKGEDKHDFNEQKRAISTGSSGAAMTAMQLNRSLLPNGGHVNGNGDEAFGTTLPTSSESISVGKVAWAVVILSDMTKQMADEPPEARHAFREWRREEVS